MYKLTSQIQSRNVTPEEARHFLAINNFEGQRALNPIKARYYADLIRERLMRPPNIATAILKDGQKVLMNGQHCCQAIIISGKPFPCTIEHYKCDSNGDAWKLFASFDVHATRTEGHVMKAARGLFSEGLKSIPLRTLQAAGSALYILGDGENPRFNGQPPNKAVKPNLVAENEELLSWLSEFSEERYITKVPVFAAMIATYRANEECAREFWGSIKDGDNLRGVARVFRDLLMRNQVGATSFGGHLRARSIYIACIAYWNSWMSGENRRSVKIAAMKDIPKPAATRNH
jgi:hypothetical protein